MPFTVPNHDEAEDEAQATWYKTDIDILVAGIGPRAVLTGCAVTEQGTPDMTVHVDDGTIRVDGDEIEVTNDDLSINAAHATLPRLDLISATALGVPTYTAGTAADPPKPPALPSGHVGLAIVFVAPTVTEIETPAITDKRVIFHPSTGGVAAPLLYADFAALHADGDEFADTSGAGWTFGGAGFGTSDLTFVDSEPYDPTCVDISFGDGAGRYMYKALPGGDIEQILTLHGHVAWAQMMGLFFVDDSGAGTGMSMYNNGPAAYLWALSAYQYAASANQISASYPLTGMWESRTPIVMKLRKEGSSISGYLSYDGGLTFTSQQTRTDTTTHTRMGIGSFLNSGGATARIRAGRYNLKTGVLDPLNVPPSSAHSKDDEFPSSPLDGKWTNPLTSAADQDLALDFATRPGWLRFEPATSGTSNTGKHVFGIRQSAPAGSFSVSAQIREGLNGSDIRSGVYVGINGGKGHVAGGFHQDGQVAAIGVTTVSNTADWSGFDGFQSLSGFTGWVTAWTRIRWDATATTLYFDYSRDGESWVNYGSRTGQSQPDQIGVAIYSNSGIVNANEFIEVNWFRVTEP